MIKTVHTCTLKSINQFDYNVLMNFFSSCPIPCARSVNGTINSIIWLLLLFFAFFLFWILLYINQVRQDWILAHCCVCLCFFFFFLLYCFQSNFYYFLGYVNVFRLTAMKKKNSTHKNMKRKNIYSQIYYRWIITIHC